MSGHHLVIIANPRAGGGRPGRLARPAAARLRELGCSVEVLFTARPGEARDLAAEAAARGVERVVACGGDGTVHEVIGGLYRTGSALGILPFGRGNDFATALGIPRRLEPACAILARGATSRVDLGLVNGVPFGTVVAAGFDAEVAVRVRADWWARLLGRLAYTVAPVVMLPGYRTPRVRLEGDFGVREGKLFLVAASNTGVYGGGIRIAPGSDCRDGLLDVCVVRDLPRWRALVIFPRTWSGRHLDAPEVELLRTRELSITSDRAGPLFADGEPAGQLPAIIRVDPLALSVVANTSEAISSSGGEVTSLRS